jgi:hypothetical protein
MIDAEEQSALGEIHQQRHQIVAPLLQLAVLPLADVVYSDMHFRAAGHTASQLFTQEKVGVPPQFLRPFDGIVVRKREQAHPAALELFVDFFGIAITLAAKMSGKRSRTGS